MKDIGALVAILAENITLSLVEQEATKYEHLTYSIVYETISSTLKEAGIIPVSSDEWIDKYIEGSLDLKQAMKNIAAAREEDNFRAEYDFNEEGDK